MLAGRSFGKETNDTGPVAHLDCASLSKLFINHMETEKDKWKTWSPSGVQCGEELTEVVLKQCGCDGANEQDVWCFPEIKNRYGYIFFF